MVFEKSLTDIVKGIRASKRDTALYISACIAEIKTEIHSTDPHTKANALQKLIFLQMMGYNMSYASFATIEVMSNTRFAFKRIGYLAASQAFTQDTDVVLLTTNTLKKELRGALGPGMHGVYEAGLAINCLSNIVTLDLARDLLADLTNLTVHPQPYLRKKAILCLLKLFMKYPQGLRLTFANLQHSLLKDANPSVTSCAVNVITELSDANPKNYLLLAPSFFALLTSSSNNWMLIKVVKLLGSLVPQEPRLARKLLDPLANIVTNTQAKSLLYEAVYTITLCLPYTQKNDGSMPSNLPSIISLCAQTLKSFIQEPDQNLKYLGLVGFASLLHSYPKVLADADYRSIILACLSDDDVTIRTRALDLLIGVATRKNVMELITQLLHHVDMASGSYKIDLVVKIVDICSSDKYSLLMDFAWYMDVLVILARTKGIESCSVGSSSSTTIGTHTTSGSNGGSNSNSGSGSKNGDNNGNNSGNDGGHKNTNTSTNSSNPIQTQQQQQRQLGPLISAQITDVTLRVLPVRTYAVQRMISILLKDGKEANENSHHNSIGTFGMTTTANMMPEVLPAAAWIVGEYALLIQNIEHDNDNDGDDDDDELEVGLEDELKLYTYDSNSVGLYHSIIQALTDPANIHSTIATTQSVYIQAAMKVFAAATVSANATSTVTSTATATSSKSCCTDLELEACVSRLTMYLPLYMQSMDAEVQERAFTAFYLLDSFGLVNHKVGGGGGGDNNVATNDTMPSLALIGHDGDASDDSSVDDDEDDGDLLGLVMSTTTTSIIDPTSKPNGGKGKKNTLSTIMNQSSSSSTLAQKSRAASETLKYLLIPEQMKPVSAKAQRKKRLSAPANIQAALEEPVNLSVFSTLLEGDRMRTSNGRCSSIEAVSFTQQKHMRITSSNEIPRKSMNVMEGFGSGSVNTTAATTAATTATSLHNIAEATHAKTTELNAGTSLNHPFYLNTNDDKAKNEKEFNNRFGAIQLLDSDGEDSDHERHTKKKKKKKDRRQKNKKNIDADFDIFSSKGNTTKSNKSVPGIMIDSDDDDDGDDNNDEPFAMFHGKMKAPSKSHFEDFDSLAQVDLTTPLREDETMPIMQHRVVPDRQADKEAEITINHEQSKKKKKNKKGKISKKSKEAKVPAVSNVANNAREEPATGTLDLLDFSGLSMDAPPKSTDDTENDDNPINNAFDDLLALDMPVASTPAPTIDHSDHFLMGGENNVVQEKIKKSRPSQKTTKVWQEATIKASKAEGQNMPFDWDDLKVLYRIHAPKRQGQNNVMVTVQIVNNSDKSLQNVEVKLKEGNQSAEFDELDANSSVESRKIGPFSMNLNSLVTEIRGSLVLSGCSVPLKIILSSCTFTSTPIANLSQDDVTSLLSSSDWSSSSAKIQISGKLGNEKMKAMLLYFLQAYEVDFGNGDGLNSIFASQTLNGSKVLVLIKGGNKAIKADIKSTDKDTAKAISSSMKRIVF